MCRDYRCPCCIVHLLLRRLGTGANSSALRNLPPLFSGRTCIRRSRKPRGAGAAGQAEAAGAIICQRERAAAKGGGAAAAAAAAGDCVAVLKAAAPTAHSRRLPMRIKYGSNNSLWFDYYIVRCRSRRCSSSPQYPLKMMVRRPRSMQRSDWCESPSECTTSG